jgi:hypothetical protein
MMDIRQGYCKRETEILYIIQFNSMLQRFTERISSNILPLSLPNLANSIGCILGKNGSAYQCTFILLLCPSIHLALQPRVRLGLLNNQSPLLPIFCFLRLLLYPSSFVHIVSLLPRLIFGYIQLYIYLCIISSANCVF